MAMTARRRAERARAIAHRRRLFGMFCEYGWEREPDARKRIGSFAKTGWACACSMCNETGQRLRWRWDRCVPNEGWDAISPASHERWRPSWAGH